MLSLESVLGFVTEYPKGEIVRLNLINHLVGFIPCQICLYLGGNYVRVVCVRKCEELFKCVQRSRDSQLDLAGGSWLQAAKLKHTCQAC